VATSPIGSDYRYIENYQSTIDFQIDDNLMTKLNRYKKHFKNIKTILKRNLIKFLKQILKKILKKFLKSVFFFLKKAHHAEGLVNPNFTGYWF
jgi:hypothetical protein